MTERTPVRTKEVKVPGLSQRLDAISAHVEKTVTDAKVLRYDGPIAKCPVISTGSHLIDQALGVGGYPCGRIVEIFGPESSGKTTLTLHAIAEAQKAGGVAMFIDAEHALDVNYARQLGVDIDKVLISQPDNGEQALKIVDTVLDTGFLQQGDIVVVDSVAALTPKAEIDGDVGDTHVGLHARLMSQSLRMITAKLYKSGALLYFTNQQRDKIGPYGGTTTTGGNALKFYASVRLSIRRTSTLTVGTGNDARSVANNVAVKVAKNKMAPPFVEVETVIRFGEGISKTDELIKLGVECGVIVVNGSWYSLSNNERIGQGKDNAVTYLKLNSEARAFVESAVRTHVLRNS